MNPGDNMSLEVTIALITFVIVFLILRNFSKNGKPIPGPWGFPVVGNMFQIGDLPHIKLAQMKNIYGDVFRIKLGKVPVIVVSGLETMRKVLVTQGEGFAARPNLYTVSLMAGTESFIFSPNYGGSWKIHKKIARNALRTLSKSEAKTSTCSCLLEEYVSIEAAELAKTLLEQTERNGYFNPANEITHAVANVISTLCLGKRYETTDKDFVSVTQISEEAQRGAACGAVADFIPLVRYLPLSDLKAFLESSIRFNSFVNKVVTDHYATYDENYIKDITDALLCLNDSKKNKDKDQTLTEDQILSTVRNIFGAGFDTISAALQWMILYLIQRPDIQIRIHMEIDEKIGDNRLPRFEDRQELHYTEAFINEAFRHSSFVPFTLPHCTTTDVHLNGYFIPKDTCIYINQYQVNHDPSIWENPESFLPERFLDENGHLNRKRQENLKLFGMGIRVCLGEDVARNQVFLMVTTILQRLKLEHNPKEELDLTPVNGLAMKPKRYQLKAVLRK